MLYFRLSTFLICIEFVYLYFPVLFCLLVSVKLLAVKTASEMTYTVTGGALNSTQTKPNQTRPRSTLFMRTVVSLCVLYWPTDYIGKLTSP